MKSDFTNSPNRILRRQAVQDLTGLARSTIYAWMDRGDFPKPVRLGAKAVGWRATDIDAWIAARSEDAA